MNRQISTATLVGVLLATLLPATPALAAVEAVSGYAYAAGVDVTPVGGDPIVGGTPPAGPLSATGGSDSNGGLSSCVPTPSCSILATGERGAAIAGETRGEPFVSGSASARDISVFDGLVTGALAASQCAVDAAGTPSGGVTVTDLVVNGTAVGTDVAPGTTYDLADAEGQPAGHVIVNDRRLDAAANALTINAVRIVLDVPGNSIGTGTVELGHVECGSTVGSDPGDTVAPVTSDLDVSLVAGTKLGSRLIARLTWKASDEGGSGLARYRVQQRANGGRWQTVNSTIDTTRLDRWVNTGKTSYQFRVQAIDHAGNTGPWAEGIVLRFPVLQESSSSVRYTSGWAQRQRPGASNGAVRNSRTAGASATLTFNARLLAIVAPQNPSHGLARIYIDGRHVANVDLRGPRQEQRLVYTTSFRNGGRHTARIVVSGSTSRRPVLLDAFVLGQ